RGQSSERIDGDFQLHKQRATDTGGAAARLRQAGNTPTAKGEAVGDILVSLLLPAAHKVADAGDRTAQTFDNTITAFALEWYRRGPPPCPRPGPARRPRDPHN